MLTCCGLMCNFRINWGAIGIMIIKSMMWVKLTAARMMSRSRSFEFIAEKNTVDADRVSTEAGKCFVEMLKLFTATGS